MPPPPPTDPEVDGLDFVSGADPDLESADTRVDSNDGLLLDEGHMDSGTVSPRSEFGDDFDASFGGVDSLATDNDYLGGNDLPRAHEFLSNPAVGTIIASDGT